MILASVQTIPMDSILVDSNFNVRNMSRKDNKDGLDELVASIRMEGLRVPLTVVPSESEPGKYVLTNGHRRFAALTAIDFKDPVPVTVDIKGETEVDRTIGLITHNSGKDLAPVEKGFVYARLAKLGLKNADIARRCGVTEAQVGQYVRVVASANAVKAIDAGIGTMSDAVAAWQDQGFEKNTKAADKFFAECLADAENSKKFSRQSASGGDLFLRTKALHFALDILADAMLTGGGLQMDSAEAWATEYGFDPKVWEEQRATESEAAEAKERAKEEKLAAAAEAKEAKAKARAEAKAAKEAAPKKRKTQTPATATA